MEPVNVWIAFLGGVLSFLSPCILPVAPGFLGVITGSSAADIQSGEIKRRRVLGATAAFVLGFSVVFILLGLGSSYLGQMLRGSRSIIARLSGVLVILLGLHQAGWLPISWLYRERRVQIKHAVGVSGAFFTGLAFSFGWTPCTGPILASILALAGSEAVLGKGLLLLAVYSLGLALPFLLLALAFAQMSKALNKVKPYMKYLEWTSGILLILMGALLVSGGFGMFISWLLRITGGGWNLEGILRK